MGLKQRLLTRYVLTLRALGFPSKSMLHQPQTPAENQGIKCFPIITRFAIYYIYYYFHYYYYHYYHIYMTILIYYYYYYHYYYYEIYTYIYVSPLHITKIGGLSSLQAPKKWSWEPESIQDIHSLKLTVRTFKNGFFGETILSFWVSAFFQGNVNPTTVFSHHDAFCPK